MSNGDKRAEIYTYASQDQVYAMNWSVSSRGAWRGSSWCCVGAPHVHERAGHVL